MAQFAVIRGGRESAPSQTIDKSRKIAPIRQHICTNQHVRDSVLRLARGYSELQIKSFRRVAQLANTTEDIVYSVVQDELRSLAPYSPHIRRAA